MSIRIGDSACLSRAMITPQSRAVESRRYWDFNTEWLEIADQCIWQKKFSITTICLNYFQKDKFIPTEIQWRNKVEDTVKKLLTKGANLNNSRVDIINEPTKHVRDANNHPDVNKYIWLEHIAVDQIRGRLLTGFGCDELIYDGWQSNVVSRCRGKVYVIHIQASCDTKAKTTMYVARAKNRSITYGKILDCNEGNYKNVSSSSGFSLMKFQAEEAERNGCANYCNVFNNLVRSAFKGPTTNWDFLAFKIDGVFRNDDAERHYNEWTGLMESKAPVPNLPIIVEDEEDMKLDVLKVGSKGNQVLWLQEILSEEYGYPNDGGFDGIYGAKTAEQVKAYQEDMGLETDGVIGKFSTFELIEKSGEHFTSSYWQSKLEIYMAYT